MLTFDHRWEDGPELLQEMKRLAAVLDDMERIRSGEPPETIAGKDPPVLDQWFFACRSIPSLIGHSTGHPRLPGHNRLIATSDLLLMSEDQEWARTRSRWYRLGRPAGETDLQS